MAGQYVSCCLIKAKAGGGCLENQYELVKF